MINFIRSVKLQNILPNSTNIEFDREKVIKGEAEIELTIQSELSESTEKKQCKLTFSAEAKSKSNIESPFLTATFSVDYIFDLIDQESYDSMSADDKGCLCANLVFMDFRRKLQTALATVGMSSVKLPLSLIDIT